MPPRKKQSPPKAPQALHRESLSNLGTALVALVRGMPTTTYDDMYAIGKVVDSALRAGTKAAIPGKQKNTQITDPLLRQRKAVNRQLARVAERLQLSNAEPGWSGSMNPQHEPDPTPVETTGQVMP